MPPQTNSGKELNDEVASQQLALGGQPPGRKHLVLALVFLTAFGVRLLNWQTYRSEVSAVQTSVALNYKHQAQLIHDNGVASLYNASSPTNNPDLLGHPLGYPILLLSSRLDDGATQFIQVVFDAFAAVLIVMIAFELLPTAVGVITGFFAAFAPQFSWNSILLLPDSLAAVPILIAILVLVRPQQSRKQWIWFALAGTYIGASCWLRANALLLAPFLVLLVPVICKRGQRLKPALFLVAAACLTIAPLTIRNAVVFGKFIPVSLGAGQTMLEGLADYDDGSLGLPQTDQELIQGEATAYQRPDYANSLFSPDGPALDRARMVRGLKVIGGHPFWFAGVMVRRAASMLRLERTPLRLARPNSNLLASLLRQVQRLFVTAIFLPLTLLGVFFLIRRRQFQTLAFLLVIPFYYFCVQSALHTEYRYVLVIHYFLFTLSALGIYVIAAKLIGLIRGFAKRLV